MRKPLALTGVVAAFVLLAQLPLATQIDRRDRRLPLGPNRPRGEAVTPFMEGWYANPDGTYTISFGYFNLNTEETIEIPLGPNNSIEPAEFGGMQPTYFPAPTRGGAGGAERRVAGYDRHERGVFTVTVPADFADGQKSLVWTLRVHGETHTLKASIGSTALQLDYGPRAMGSVPPLLAFAADGPRGQHPTGITLERTLTASVGTPLEMTVWVSDPSERSKELLGALYEEVPVRLTWFKHQGPVGGEVAFERVGEPWQMPAGGGEETQVDLTPYQDRVAPSGGQSTMRATFGAPGAYVLRVRADNWTGSHDSSAGNQCCWTNGYVKVTVTR